MTWQYTDSDICIQISFTFISQTRFLNILYNNAVNYYDHTVSVTDEITFSTGGMILMGQN